MLKKSSLIALLLASVAMQTQAADSGGAFNGGYAGVLAGYESFNAKNSDTGIGSLAGLSSSGDYSATGKTGGIFAGYGKEFGKLYLGAEAEATLGNAQEKTNITLGNYYVYTDVQHKYDYGLSIRPGFLVSDNALVYTRIGYVRSRFDDKAVDENFNLNGLRLGLGSEFAISANLNARLDWVYTNYQSHNYSDSYQISKTDTSSNTFRVGLAYHF